MVTNLAAWALRDQKYRSEAQFRGCSVNIFLINNKYSNFCQPILTSGSTLKGPLSRYWGFFFFSEHSTFFRKGFGGVTATFTQASNHVSDLLGIVDPERTQTRDRELHFWEQIVHAVNVDGDYSAFINPTRGTLVSMGVVCLLLP